MRRLIIDTATNALSVALIDRGGLCSQFHEIVGRGHAELLMPVIAGMDGGGRADEIWVDSGPGSFTGIRVGVAAARALAFAWGARVRSYSSLSLVAAMAKEASALAGQNVIMVALTGGHGELFWQEFDRESLRPRTAAASTPIAALALETGVEVIAGTGAEALICARGHGDALILHPDARCAPLIPHDQVSEDGIPLYGRSADAQPARPVGQL